MAKSKVAMQVAMIGAGASIGDAALEALLSDLDTNKNAEVSEIIEVAPTEAAPPVVLADIPSAEPQQQAGDGEVIENEQGAEQSAETVEPGAEVAPITDAKARKEAAKAAKVAAKQKKEEERLALKAKREEERVAKKAEKDAADAAKPAPQPRIFFADKADRIAHRLGADLGNYMVLEIADALLEGDALKAKQDETFAMIRDMSVKVKNRASLLLDFAAGKKAELNSVIATAFRTLKADGKITVGDKGNFIVTLLARPYSLNSARAMGNNTISLLKQLKVLVDGGKGMYVANPNSLILAKVNGLLGL
jgi:hypothetical protein